jgi:hypothetical protein
MYSSLNKEMFNPMKKWLKTGLIKVQRLSEDAAKLELIPSKRSEKNL